MPYMGKLFSFTNTNDVEIGNRIAKAWAKFGTYRDELTSKAYDLNKRLKIFKTIVQPTLLDRCSCWTMIGAREQLLQTTQRKMMRQIVGFRRLTTNGKIEEWVDWMIRTARECETVMQEHGVPNWIEEVHRRSSSGWVAWRNAKTTGGQQKFWLGVWMADALESVP